MSGIFMTFEGGEGAGKSTQVKRLANHLSALGRDVVITREPGGSPLAESIRAVLLADANASREPLTQALLFAAARRDHVLRVIRPALARGAVVLCDRFADSTRAYQGGGLAQDVLETTITLATDGLTPDLTLLLDLSPEAGLKRSRSRGSAGHDPFETSELAFHEGVRARFLALATHENRFAIIDAAAEADVVAARILDTLAARLPELAG